MRVFLKYKTYIIVIVLLASVAVLASGCNNAAEFGQACLAEHCFNVELAENIEDQSRGLMFRESLAADAGMLFVFTEEQQPTFWMKNVLIPLDIIWLDADQRVVAFNENMSPCADNNCPAISPPEKILYVLEVNAGSAEKYGIKVGEEVERM